jgi:integrase/recombinase XerD
MPPSDDRSPADISPSESSNELTKVDSALAFMGRSSSRLTEVDLRARFTEACEAWLAKSPSKDTRTNYARDVAQFLNFIGADPSHLEVLASVRPSQVAAWRDQLWEQGRTNSSIMRKMTAVRSLYSYLQTYGYTGVNPAHSDFVDAPAVPRDGKTVGLSSEDCRRLLEAPDATTPVGLRDRAMLAVLAYTGCRVGELARLKVGSYKATGGHKVLEIHGKGGKERRVPLHPEAFERLEEWLDVAGIREVPAAPLFPPPASSRGKGRDGFRSGPMSRRAIQFTIERFVRRLGLDPAVTVHSFRVTALTTARERGADIIDLQDFAGHADPRTTLTYIRQRDRLSKSPAYVLRY